MTLLPDEPPPIVNEGYEGQPFVVDLDVYTGPIEALLNLAREKKLDVLHVPMTVLADQYLSFIRERKRLNLTIASDYLLMAAWLTWLKSRLLLPKEEQEKDPLPAYQQEEILRQRLHHYAVIQERARLIAHLPQKGHDFFARGTYGLVDETTDDTSGLTASLIDISLYDLLAAYRRNITQADKGQPLTITMPRYTVHDACKDIRTYMTRQRGEKKMSALLPQLAIDDSVSVKMRIIILFNACLELSRQGVLSIQQTDDLNDITIKHA
ncbi:MAG: segregation/condensation protein A [Alphaproteobacteria bacterium GM202ARS2]|nr:segregation/condensation protein A [Alphaproteobacteria bacterium GM202ARS2]